MIDEVIQESVERIIKSKKRVQNHGEVFTPNRIVNMMLNLPGVKKSCEELQTTFLEPSVGEGAFLMEVLRRKLIMVKNIYNKSLDEYENYALLALSTLYGIELLEDNAQICVMNMYEIFDEFYNEQVTKHDGKLKNKVRNSAKKIISQNIIQGNFLTGTTSNDKPIIFSEWKPVSLRKGQKKINVDRTEYELDDLYEGSSKEVGKAYTLKPFAEQIDLFSIFNESNEEIKTKKIMRYISVNITEVYREEMEEVDEN